MTVIWLAVAAAPGVPGVPGAPGAPGVPATPGDPAWPGRLHGKDQLDLKTSPVQAFISCLCTASRGRCKPHPSVLHLGC